MSAPTSRAPTTMAFGSGSPVAIHPVEERRLIPRVTTMRAIEIAGHGGPEVLRAVRRPVPELRAGDVLIRVAGAGVNRPDVMQRMGKYPPPPGASDLPGLEVSGEVYETAGATRFTKGDRVCALVAGGGYAEFCAAPAEQCLPV